MEPQTALKYSLIFAIARLDRRIAAAQAASRRISTLRLAIVLLGLAAAIGSAVLGYTALSARRAAWLVIRVPSDLQENERSLLEKLLEQCAPVKTAYDLAQAFGTMVRERKSEELTDWIGRAKASGVAELKNFAIGLSP